MIDTQRLAGIVIVGQTEINTKHRGWANTNQEMFALNRQNPASKLFAAECEYYLFIWFILYFQSYVYNSVQLIPGPNCL